MYCTHGSNAHSILLCIRLNKKSVSLISYIYIHMALLHVSRWYCCYCWCCCVVTTADAAIIATATHFFFFLFLLLLNLLQLALNRWMSCARNNLCLNWFSICSLCSFNVEKMSNHIILIIISCSRCYFVSFQHFCGILCAYLMHIYLVH